MLKLYLFCIFKHINKTMFGKINLYLMQRCSSLFENQIKSQATALLYSLILSC